MDSKENGRCAVLVVTGSRAPVSDAGLPSKRCEPIKPTNPQGNRMLHSARSTNISYKALNTKSDMPTTRLSFSAPSFVMPLQYVPISVVLDADLPGMPARKQSVIFKPRKEETVSLQNTPRMLASTGCIQSRLRAEDLSKSADSNSSQKTEFHVDVVAATISPRPPAPVATEIKLPSKPKTPRIVRRLAEHNPNTPQGVLGPTDPELSPLKPADTQMRMRMKRRAGDFDVGAFDISHLPEEVRRIHESLEPGQAIASLHAFPDVSHADQVSELENWVQDDMSKSQFNRDIYQKIVAKTTAGNNSTLKFAFPHSSPAQLFILPQSIIKLGETATLPSKSRPIPQLNSMSTGSQQSPVIKNDHSVDLEECVCTIAKQEVSPRQKNTFYVQKDAFILKSVARSNPRTTPHRETQQPILFNHIGPLDQISDHDSRAANAALIALTMKPQQVSKLSAEHQKHHIMCNNRVPDFFLAAMHRK